MEKVCRWRTVNRGETQSDLLREQFLFLFQIETVAVIQAEGDDSMNSRGHIKDSGWAWWTVFVEPISRTVVHSLELWAVLFRATQDRRVIVESSNKTWSTGGGNGKPFPYSCCENPMNSMNRQKRYDTRRWAPPPRSESVQYATGEERGAITNSTRKNEAAGPKE